MRETNPTVVQYVGLDPYLVKKGREENPTVVRCGGPDPYERGKRGGDDEMPTVVQGGLPDPHTGKGGGGAERRRNDGKCSHVARAILVNEAGLPQQK